MAAPNTLPVYRRILVPTDLSERAERALAHACALVAPKGTIHLVHVMERHEAPNPLYAHYGPVIPTAEEWERMRREASVALDSLARTCPPPHGVEVHRHVLEAPQGHVVTVLCRAEQEFGAELVCIASHGRSGLKRVLLGSVAEALLRRGRVPTLIVRVDDADLAHD
ncbi:MAG: universal stress protein [Planctomycetes bacterium]|nr:universal stress protein [Planctomycetota bacterium]